MIIRQLSKRVCELYSITLPLNRRINYQNTYEFGTNFMNEIKIVSQMATFQHTVLRALEKCHQKKGENGTLLLKFITVVKFVK